MSPAGNQLARPPVPTFASTPTTRCIGGSGRRSAGRGRPTRCTDPAVGRLRRMPLVSRHGPRVVRGRRGGRRDERGFRVRQSRPRGAARHRRGLHERHRRAHRAGWLAHDMFPDARRTPLLLRHLLSESWFPATAFGSELSTWRDRRDEVEQASDHIASELQSMAGNSGQPGGGPEVAASLCDDAVAARAARRGHRARRFRRRTEIPAVGVARGAATAR